jgi:autotransporter-associated beta strand protein
VTLSPILQIFSPSESVKSTSRHNPFQNQILAEYFPMKIRLNPFVRSTTLAASIFVGLAASAQAQTNYFWDSNGGTTGTGGAGNWSTTNTWRESSATGTLGNWVDGGIANFGGTAGGVTITSGVTITTPRINVSANNYSLSGGTVAFGGSAANPGIIDLTTSGTFTFASNATGSLRVLSTGSTANLTTAAAMLINGSTNLTSFELALAGDGNSITINNAAALGSSSSTVKLTKGVLYLGNNAAPNNDVPISYNAWATDLAGGTIRARFNASTWNGATSLSANSLFMARGSASLNVSLIFSSTGTINLNANTLSINAASTSAGVDLQGVVSGTGNITLVNTALGGSENGQGITKLSAANTFSGTATTTQNLGTLALNHINALQNATLNTGVSGTQAVTFTAAGTTYNIGAITGSDALSIGANTISVGNKAGSSSFGADITGTGGLTKTGSSSTQTLTAATSYSGATNITGGTLSLTGTGAANSSSGITINGSGAKLLHTGGTAISPAVSLTQGTLTGSGTVNTVNVGAGTGGIISNNNGVAGAALTIGNLTLAGAANIDLFSNSTSAPLVITSALTTGTTAATITANNSLGWANGTTYNLITYGGGSIAGSGNNFIQAVNNLSARQNATWANTGSALQITINGDNPRWMGDTNGNWNLTTTNNWKLVTGGGYTNFLASDDVIFDDNATGTRNVDINTANVTANSTIFNNTTSAAYTLDSSGGFGISAGSLTKNNTGTVTITSANTYAGPTNINGGSIVLSGAGTLGTGSALTLGGGALDLGGLSRSVGAVSITAESASGDTISNGSLTGTSYSATNTSGNAIISASLLANGAIGFTKTGTGTVTLAGANTYTGNTNINAGSILLSGSGTLGNGAALNLGGGSLNLGGLSSTVGAVSVTAAAASGNTISNGSLTGTSYAASNISGDAIISANLLVNGSAGFTKSGAGTTTLSGLNTYTGATAVSAGTLKVGSASAFGTSSALNLSSTGTFDLGGFNASFTNLTSTATNTITSTGAGAGTDVISISALGSDTGASALFTDNGPRKLQVNLTSGGVGSWQATSNTSNTFSGGLILNGSMRASVSAGGVGTPGSITSGQFGTGTVTVNGNSQIWFATSNRTILNDIVVNGNTGNGNRSGTFRIGSNSVAVTGLVISGNINANLAEAHFGADPTSGGSALLLSGKLTGNSGFRFFSSSNNQAWTTTLNNATGSPNDYAGSTTINSSLTTLALGASNQIPNGAGKGNVVLSSGFLDLAGFDETINGLSGGGTVNNVASGTANTLTLGDGDATAQNFSGAIQNSFGNLGLTKIGTGTQILSGTNTYTGATLISGGTLQIGNGGATGVLSSSSTITNNGTLAFNRTGTVTQGTNFAAGITGTGALTTSGTGTVILSGTNGYTGATTISNGELRLTSATAINGTSGITVNSGRLSLDGGITVGSGKSITVNGTGANFFGALQGNSGANEWQGDVVVGSTTGTRIGVNSGSLKISGAISGSTALNGVILRPNTATTLELSGANTYLGDTTIVSNTGEVKLSGGANRLPTGTKLIFGGSNVSGILNLNGQNQEIAGLSVISGTTNEIKSATAATLTVNTAADSPSTYAGIITGSTALTKTGSETLTLSGANSYTGNTTISQGTLALGATGTIANSTNLIVGATGSSGTVLDVSAKTGGFTIGSTQTLSGIGTVDANDGTNKYTVTIEGTHAVGNSPGSQTIDGNLSYSGASSIFEWDLNATATDPGAETANSGTYDQVNVTGDLGGSGAVFKVVLGANTFADAFWDTSKTWSNVFTVTGSPTNLETIFTTVQWFQGATDMTGSTVTRGSFSVNGSTLTWSAVPEPTSALVGLLIGAGLLRRRRGC